MGRGALAIGAVLIVAGGGALGYALTRQPVSTEMSPEQTGAMASAITTLDGSLKEAHSIARERATTIAQNSYLQNGLRTGDETTAQDQVKKGETKYQLKEGELIEVGMVTPKGNVVLSRQPEGAAASGVGGKTASLAKLVGERVMIMEVVEVADGGKTLGYVTVVQPRELRPVFDQLVAAGIVGRFELGGVTVPIGSALPADAQTTEKMLGEAGAKLVVASPKAAEASAMRLPLIGAGAGVAALGLLLVIIGMMTGKKTVAANPPTQAYTTIESLPPGQTRLTHNVAAGTPSPVDPDGHGPSINPSNIGAGAMIGRWEVIRRLGSGGMADVYLAHTKGEAGFEKLVAIKVMHAHLARNERAVEHFLDEARLAARISHPNVVAIQDLGKIGSDYVIVMEYVEGVDLERLLASARTANRPIPIDVGLGILCRICDGLNAAHTAVGADGVPLGVIHRDVKSANVLVSKNGGVKVVDFGIAKAANQSHLTAAGETKGTPSMMAPEQRVGERVDVRADVYSVAAVGYEIVTGHGVNLDLAALAHLGVENWPHLPVPSSLRPQLPVELDQILLGAMAFERDKRPSDCLVFEEQVATLMKKHGLSASDKDIARWVDTELQQLIPAYVSSSIVSKPVNLS
ncbi:MAG: serine/threonine-protein kinase [Kofleriaceae bacterium]